MTAQHWADLAGGVGLFLYGMLLMTTSMEQAAAGPLQRILHRATRTLPRAILTGAILTGIIQSSGAAVLLCIGLAEAGLLPLRSAAGVVMGANIGTTVTAQLLALGGQNPAGGPAAAAPGLCLAGALLCLFRHRQRMVSAGKTLLGFGLLFSGLDGVAAAAAPLGQSARFFSLLAALHGPVTGLCLGMLSSFCLQSSSAAVGLLQALAATGALSWRGVIPLILGQNIGTCLTPLFAAGAGGSAGAGAICARFNLLFNLLGSGLCLLLLFPGNGPGMAAPVSSCGIANFHSLFNLGTVLLLAPLTGPLLRLAQGCPQKKSSPGPLA